jgi:hypothetical protein
MLRFIFIAPVLFLMAGPVHSQGDEMTGSYVAVSEVGSFTLTLEVDGAGACRGVLAGDGGQFTLEGRREDGAIKGRAGDGVEVFFFVVEEKEGGILFTLYGMSEYAQPDLSTGETLLFERVSGEKSATAGISKPSDGTVQINGRELSQGEVSALAREYGVSPLPGNYWYDPKSGLYGVVGYPAYGFMRPGHDLGAPKRGASNGDTGVFINGRELPMTEFTVWSYIVGSWIQPGAYWLDHYGNAGYEGNPAPVINLYTAAQQNSYGGKGSGGDNFWSSRFSAGNSNADNSQGYVSVPGYGPVGYGF